jgi:predicted DNA-binding WGR domain protein
MRMDIDRLQHRFTYWLLEWINPEQNENRFYYLAWQPSLFAEGAIVRSYGRKDGRRPRLFGAAWPSAGYFARNSASSASSFCMCSRSIAS